MLGEIRHQSEFWDKTEDEETPRESLADGFQQQPIKSLSLAFKKLYAVRDTSKTHLNNEQYMSNIICLQSTLTQIHNMLVTHRKWSFPQLEAWGYDRKGQKQK